MGVQQFLGKVLSSAGREMDLRSYANVHGRGERPLRVAVDIASVVYRATQGFGETLGDDRHLDNYGRAELRREEQEAAANQEKGKDASSKSTDPDLDPKVATFVQKCTQYVMKFLEQFAEAGIDVLVVLDGETPPIKADQVKLRSNKRKDAEAKRDASVNDTEVSKEARVMSFRRAGAGKHFSLVIDAVIASMRSRKIPFLVAPYESDGQLAFLSENKYVDLVVTEDSDLLACGATPVMYKVSTKKKDAEDGDGLCGKLLRMEDLPCAKDLDLMDFSSAMLATVFIAAGSDYCKKLKGIGIKTACDSARNAFYGNREDDDNRSPLEIFFQQIYRASYEKNLSDEFKRDYEKRFLGALLMFRHPVVFNPITARSETFRWNNPDPELTLYEPYAKLLKDPEAQAEFVGVPIESPLVCYLAEGWLNPKSLRPRRYEKLPEQVDVWFKRWEKVFFAMKTRTGSVAQGPVRDQPPPANRSGAAADHVGAKAPPRGASNEDAIPIDDSSSSSLEDEAESGPQRYARKPTAEASQQRPESQQEGLQEPGFETQPPMHE